MSASLEEAKHNFAKRENNNRIITEDHRAFDENFIALRTKHFTSELFNIVLIKIDQLPVSLFSRYIAVKKNALT